MPLIRRQFLQQESALRELEDKMSRLSLKSVAPFIGLFIFAFILLSIGLHKEKDEKLYGDYEEEEIKNIAGFYTPTPGGVGPVNVACLLENLIKASTKTSY